jgi:hypothetical protein
MSPNCVYVAGSTSDIERVRRAQRICVDVGWAVSFDWTGVEGEIRHDWSAESELATRHAKRELLAISKSDVLVLCVPESPHGLGCFIETGMAMMIGIDIVLVGPIRESVFWYLPGINKCQEDELGAMMQSLAVVT